MSRGKFVMLPLQLLYATDVSAEAKVCWAALQDATKANAHWDATTAQLAALLSVEERQARRLTRQLAAAGWLRIDSLGRSGNRYVLLGRARDVDVEAFEAVDGPRSEMSALAVKNVRGHGVPTSIRAHEESRGQIPLDWSSGAPRRRPWCGRCDEPTRHLPVDGGSSYRRCPDCHTLTAAPF